MNIADILSVGACAYLLALGIGPLVFCGSGWTGILSNEPIRWALTIPGLAWPVCRRGYFRWSLPPVVVEFWSVRDALLTIRDEMKHGDDAS